MSTDLNRWETHTCDGQPSKDCEACWAKAYEPLNAYRAEVERLRKLVPVPIDFERQQVSRGDFGEVVRFELETDTGVIVRYEGEEASTHVAAIDAACLLAGVHGMSFPDALPRVGRRSA